MGKWTVTQYRNGTLLGDVQQDDMIDVVQDPVPDLIQRRLQALRDMVDTAKTVVDDIRARLRAGEDRITAIEGRVRAGEDRFVALEGRLTAIDAALKVLNDAKNPPPSSGV